ncbi:hypothetical protein DTL42_17960 [Bremerella cremea]|uniref:Pre-toxin TG domain-containing protein n=1 Tax=Bremerella cremea TaxID=1031537 RepID=A0A368KN70_9BACT|nr:hypothetical protein DTL42_17960 [Bremerella cremea]
MYGQHARGNAFTSAIEAASGKEAITGRALSGTERGFRALEAGAGGLGGFAAATSDLARSGTKTRKALDNAADAAEDIAAINRVGLTLTREAGWNARDFDRKLRALQDLAERG